MLGRGEIGVRELLREKATKCFSDESEREATREQEACDRRSTRVGGIATRACAERAKFVLGCGPRELPFQGLGHTLLQDTLTDLVWNSSLA